MKWIKIILLCCIVSIISCRKLDVIPTPISNDIFSTKQSTISNGDDIKFNLKSDGIYTLTLFDSVGQRVITRERIIGKNGTNTLKLYTRSLPVKYLYLVLDDEGGNQINKTTIIIN